MLSIFHFGQGIFWRHSPAFFVPHQPVLTNIYLLLILWFFPHKSFFLLFWLLRFFRLLFLIFVFIWAFLFLFIFVLLFVFPLRFVSSLLFLIRSLVLLIGSFIVLSFFSLTLFFFSVLLVALFIWWQTFLLFLFVILRLIGLHYILLIWQGMRKLKIYCR